MILLYCYAVLLDHARGATALQCERLKDEGNAAFSQGRHKEAVAMFSKALELEPRYTAGSAVCP